MLHPKLHITRTLPPVWPMFICLLLALLLPLPLHAQYRVTHLEKPFNTPGSETAAIRVGDTILAYSSMPPSTAGRNMFGFETAQTQIWQARISRSGKIAKPRLSRWGINSKHDHTGNLAIDPLSHDIYFTRCRVGDPNLRCDIWWAKKLKRGWAKAQKLRGPVNNEQYTATQPAIGRLPDSTTILYFVSNRPQGEGGMDIWYAIVKNGIAKECVNLGPNVNTPSDEITPFFDQRNQVLYFSSNRPGGLGGYDIYFSPGSRNTWQPSQALCQCIQSPQNDIYFTISACDSALGIPTAGYLSSNRTDSYFLNDSLCCNDIYEWTLDPLFLPLPKLVKPDIPDTTYTVKKSTLKFLFPLFLYFHNDQPDPTSRSSSTSLSYSECQHAYSSLRSDYLSHQKTAEDSLLMTEFFDSCVVGNFRRVEALFDFIEEQLDEDHSIVLTIAGYASPSFTSEYNQALSERRIASFVNMILSWREGLFANAIHDGKFSIVQQPHGAVSPTTASKNTDPVYGLPAALARRIEILSCEIR